MIYTVYSYACVLMICIIIVHGTVVTRSETSSKHNQREILTVNKTYKLFALNNNNISTLIDMISIRMIYYN